MDLKIALAGNPNSGKTTLFNALTGSNQFVGNWPGVTVEKKEGRLKQHDGVVVVDLPGIYSLSPYTMEEVVARNYLIGERPDVILNIVDGTNLERNLYLTTQLIELGIPVVVAINMMDVVRKRGDKLDIKGLSRAIGCPVTEISALKGTGIEEVAEVAIEASRSGRKLPLHIFSGAVEHALAHIEEAAVHGLPEDQQRWYAIKIFERDEKTLEQLQIPAEKRAHIEADIVAAEKELDDDAESIITNERYLYVERVLKGCYQKKSTGRATASDRIDRVLTNRFAALPIFALIMFLVYYLSVTTVGTIVTDFTNDALFGEGFSFFGSWVPGIPVLVESGLVAANCPEWLCGLILDGIVGGVGAVLGFVPQMLVLFALLGFLEACGYMARIAFVLDRIFRKFGLSGKSFIPLLVGTGCGVPGIMASRTIENERDRRMTVITTTFIPCGAKLPMIAMITAALFGGPEKGWWLGPLCYFIGIAAIVISGIILKKTKLFAGDPAPFVMELPDYHWPTPTNVLRSMWERGWSFIKKAGTVILLSSILIWIGTVFGVVDGQFVFDPDMAIGNSILGMFGNAIRWIFIPLGFGSGESGMLAAVATILGLIAKEEVVTVFGVAGFTGFGALAGFSFLVFNLLCAPCFAAMGAIRREMNSGKWTAFAITYQCVFAYAVCLMIYQFGSLFTGNVQGLQIVWVELAVAVLGFMLFMLFRPYREAKKLSRNKK